MTKTKVDELMALAQQWVKARTVGDGGSAQQDALQLALEAALNPMEPVVLQRYEAELWREDRIRFEPDIEGDWVKFTDVCNLYATPQASPAWLPISSAPKDGTMFDGWNGERVADVTWAHPSYSATGHRAWCASEYTNWDSVEVTGLTHWLPLPSAPKDTP